ncbi:hypothetical protein IGL14_002633 [Enterococcus sp. DIV1938]|uniref:hypothetical protein n=1 Tax=Enterococcus TaxID=1350 RepID=UPI000352787A|nr:hypothetical protein [Enterococcus faecalis]EPH83409.1 LPXTG-motif protein cell wall anchor domain protein [Enterococcus faecalis 02-MB-BW-10]EPH86702.1 LPXTG-motif protein cell wall anchor domain protein [Enterococcus faecalis 06-MB-S-10]EPH91184.1 LPXTG-motif protein cell wall anchor domain protein [Enterococcus faecalis 06-MB-S-04]
MRKKKIKTCLAMMVVMAGLASTGFGVSASAESADQAKSEVAVTLTRKVTPSELPGNNGEASHNASAPSLTIPPQTKGATSGVLPYTGAVQSYWWGMIGSFLVAIALTVKSVERKIRKED